MLSRTANDLFWMSRDMERAENVARMLDVTYRMSLLPYKVLEPGQEWAEPWVLPLVITGLVTPYYKLNAEIHVDDVLRYMVLDAGNPCSIYSCLKMARENGRSQRGAVSSEMWECLNATWLEMRGMTFNNIHNKGMSEFFEWVKTRSQLFRGITFGTMLRDEAYRFIRLPQFLERADNTARILDVKYHTLLPSVDDVGGAVDYYQWGALLRSVGSFESYRKIYSDAITPVRVAELLILRDDIPRSLHACFNDIYDILKELCESVSLEPERLAGEIHAQLHYGRTERIIEQGLHEYLMDFLDQLAVLNGEINSHFLAPTDR
ncbi:MAG: alpha-E domain-containing protein [Burkholderiales bacterium]